MSFKRSASRMLGIHTSSSSTFRVEKVMRTGRALDPAADGGFIWGGSMVMRVSQQLDGDYFMENPMFIMEHPI